MKKNIFLLLIVAVMTFTGGFIIGVFYSSNDTKQERSDPHTLQKTKQAPQSAKSPIQKQQPKIEPINPKVLMGYVQDFRDPATVDYSKLTHVIFSFAHPAKDGSVLLNGDTALTNLRSMVQKAHQHDTKAILAVGGWYHIEGGESYEYFKKAISDPDSRKKLTNELIELTESEKLDGIDIDFEHPRSMEDARNLTAFTKVLSEHLHSKDKELSIAVYSKIHSVTGTEMASVVFEPTMFQHVDHVNIMAYDGQWDGEYNAANLSPYPFTENIVNYWTNLFDEHSLSKDKLVLGVPSYAQPENVSIKQMSYAAIVNSDSKNAKLDIVEMNGTTYHYNGIPTIQKKTKLALDHGFGGMMLWESGLDAQGAHSLTGAISDVLEKEDTERGNYTVTSN